jgi:hypothetical protein
MQAFSTAGSLSFAQTTSRFASSGISPVIVIAIGGHSIRKKDQAAAT